MGGETNNEGLVISLVPAMGLRPGAPTLRQECARTAPEVRCSFVDHGRTITETADQTNGVKVQSAPTSIARETLWDRWVGRWRKERWKGKGEGQW